ncbi:hypothetical protein KHP60_12000 [Microvirga sp. 3-52]|uniref:hypothetical protein n=1 Tax=Microvirga sp. 3-52 TaxID=2792425 RepID=UPI001ACDD69F|nr:hypothetical protein [Microvirga sp. 3-52]MBO1905847.1 hypothetical protein [Microvirga sp. 3-52]MBS7453057.1 hypothetical protein [Microvirga sp. 3-52]
MSEDKFSTYEAEDNMAHDLNGRRSDVDNIGVPILIATLVLVVIAVALLAYLFLT